MDIFNIAAGLDDTNNPWANGKPVNALPSDFGAAWPPIYDDLHRDFRPGTNDIGAALSYLGVGAKPLDEDTSALDADQGCVRHRPLIICSMSSILDWVVYVLPQILPQVSIHIIRSPPDQPLELQRELDGFIRNNALDCMIATLPAGMSLLESPSISSAVVVQNGRTGDDRDDLPQSDLIDQFGVEQKSVALLSNWKGFCDKAVHVLTRRPAQLDRDVVYKEVESIQREALAANARLEQASSIFLPPDANDMTAAISAARRPRFSLSASIAAMSGPSVGPTRRRPRQNAVRRQGTENDSGALASAMASGTVGEVDMEDQPMSFDDLGPWTSPTLSCVDSDGPNDDWIGSAVDSVLGGPEQFGEA